MGTSISDLGLRAALPIVSLFTPTDGSGTITTGGTAQNLFGTAIPQHGFSIFNPDATNAIWFSYSTTAAANATGSIEILPGGLYESPPGLVPSQAISIVGAGTGQKFTAFYW